MPIRKLRSYHRWLGLGSAAFLLVLAVTGLALNHTDSLRLDERFVDAGWVLELYGLETPGEMLSFDTGAHRVTQLGSRLYLDDLEVTSIGGTLVGAAAAGRFVAAADTERLYLIDERGSLVDLVYPADEGIGPIVSIAASGGQLRLRTAVDTYAYDPESFRFSVLADGPARPDWPESSPVPDDLRESIARRYRGAGISVERILLDIHSGRIFGGLGVLLFDIVALMLVVLAGTGLWIWLGRRN